MRRPVWVSGRSHRVHAVVGGSHPEDRVTACGLPVPSDVLRQTVTVPILPGVARVMCSECVLAVRRGDRVAPWEPADVAGSVEARD